MRITVGHSDLAVKSFVFNGGEVQVRIDFGCGPSFIGDASVVINENITSSDALMGVLLVTDALRRQYGAEVPIELVAPYLPYARQDRVCYPGEALSVRVLCDILNAQRYRSVTVWDAHSDVSLALLDNVHHRTADQVLGDFNLKAILDGAILVAPDAGAAKRTASCAKMLNLPYITAEKIRNPMTGEITGTVVHSEHVVDRNFLIVDDICDGGRTFIELAKVLRTLTNGDIFLYVTHGIFSAGFDVFRGLIDRIYVGNSFIKDVPSDLVTKLVTELVPRIV